MIIHNHEYIMHYVAIFYLGYHEYIMHYVTIFYLVYAVHQYIQGNCKPVIFSKSIIINDVYM